MADKNDEKTEVAPVAAEAKAEKGTSVRPTNEPTVGPINRAPRIPRT